MKVAIGSDNAGFPLKAVVTELLKDDYAEIEVIDFGVPNADDPEYYPDVAERVARAVAEGDFDRGILMCGTGLGMAMTASKSQASAAATATTPTRPSAPARATMRRYWRWARV